jgi:5'-nucleotidase
MKMPRVAAVSIGLSLVLTAVTTGCASAPMSGRVSREPSSLKVGKTDTDPVLHILSTTDLHGYIQAQKNKAGIMTGGVDYMSGYFNIAEKQDPETLLVDSGDLFQGTLISNEAEGAPVINVYNYLGYDASTIGNHEFDYGPVGTDTVPRVPGEDPLGALKARIAQAKFPIISANICAIDEDPGQCKDPTNFQVASFTKPYVIKMVKGIHVGIIGLTTDDTSETTMPVNVKNLRFLPGAAALEQFIPRMKKDGADLILVIAHVGGFCDNGTCNPQDELFKMIDSLKPATRAQIPLILAGHTHNYINKVYNGVQLLVTGCYGRSFGLSALTIHRADKSVTVNSTKSYDFCQQVFPDTGSCASGNGKPVAATFMGEAVLPDSAAADMIASDVAEADAQNKTVVGKLLSPLPGGQPESKMGDFMADSMRFCYVDSSCSKHADVAIQNNGGIRSTITSTGPVTFGDVFQVEPFDNFVATAQLTGLQLKGVIAGLYAHQKAPPQISGMTITYNANSTATRTYTNDAGKTQSLPDPFTSIVMSDGSTLDETKAYTVILADFLATGGSGTEFIMTALKTPASVDYNREVRAALVDYFKANPNGLDYGSMPPRLITQ